MEAICNNFLHHSYIPHFILVHSLVYPLHDLTFEGGHCDRCMVVAAFFELTNYMGHLSALGFFIAALTNYQGLTLTELPGGSGKF